MNFARPSCMELIQSGRWALPFGPMVMFGLGGIFTEVMADTVFGAAPLPRNYARGMLETEVIVAKTEPCIRAATAGRWLGDG